MSPRAELNLLRYARESALGRESLTADCRRTGKDVSELRLADPGWVKLGSLLCLLGVTGLHAVPGGRLGGSPAAAGCGSIGL